MQATRLHALATLDLVSCVRRAKGCVPLHCKTWWDSWRAVLCKRQHELSPTAAEAGAGTVPHLILLRQLEHPYMHVRLLHRGSCAVR